ncbi:MAG: hypothetical protein OXL37_06805 [Chloroflexota bacterium]|nr:hypothetical protein [Chloroflexota bacterium]MDE2960792.1 hypothetical protein [Chloroflexota bacterium]
MVNKVEVRSASVVLVSSGLVNPDTVNPDKLSRAGVVPYEWSVINTVTTELAARTEYANDISISVDGNRCVFWEQIEGPFQPAYEVHDVAKRYADATRLVQYDAIGVNWSLDVIGVDPSGWLRDKVVGLGTVFGDFQTSQVRMVKWAGDYFFNITVVNDNAGILLDCNYHYQVAGNPPHLIEAILDGVDQLQNHLVSDVVSRV